MPEDIRFGTDGWRGRIAADYTFDNVRRCAQGFARSLLDAGHAKAWVVVGYDKRFASEHFAAAAAEVLAGHGLSVWLTDAATPTPAIAYSVVHRGAVGAINITASHNPPSDNGFKVRAHHGGAVDPAGLEAIEARIPARDEKIERLPLADAQSQGKLRIFDPAPDYIEHLRSHVELEPIRRAGLTVMVDAMWGNGAGWFPRLLDGGRTLVLEIHNQRNPAFPEMTRPEPIEPNIDAGLRASLANRADVMIATDGDADRIGLGDEHGRFVNQLQVYGLLALYLLEVRGQRGTIVKTLSTTSMLERLGDLYGVPVVQTGVGFKYVAPKMIETDAMIGGEESGGFAFRGLPERDGILAGLHLLDLMCQTKRKPSELVDWLFSKVGPHYYDRIDSSFPLERRVAIQQGILDAKPATIGGLSVTGLDTTDGYKFGLSDGGWLLIRFSGTEPIMRVYTETTQQDRVQSILEDGMRIAGLR